MAETQTNNAVLSILFQNVGASKILSIIDCETAYDTWEISQKQY